MRFTLIIPSTRTIRQKQNMAYVREREIPKNGCQTKVEFKTMKCSKQVKGCSNADPTKPANDFTKQVAVLDGYGERNGFMLLVVRCGFGRFKVILCLG